MFFGNLFHDFKSSRFSCSSAALESNNLVPSGEHPLQNGLASLVAFQYFVAPEIWVFRDGRNTVLTFYDSRKNIALHPNHRGRGVAMTWRVRPHMIDADQFPGGALTFQFLLDIVQENMSLAVSKCLGDDPMLLDDSRSFVQLPDGGAHGFACHLQALFVCELLRRDLAWRLARQPGLAGFPTVRRSPCAACGVRPH